MDNKKFLKYFDHEGSTYSYYDFNEISQEVENLPFSIRVLLENVLRKHDNIIVYDQHIKELEKFRGRYEKPFEIPFYPSRVLMQDFTGVPAVVDLAMMRDSIKDMGKDPKKINPVVPVDLVCDHSVQVDYYGTSDSLKRNVEKEYERNAERYKLLKWAQKSFDNLRVVPPNSGICHQVNLEYLGKVAFADEKNVVYPDTVVGTDSHTPMINGVGVLGWGVGGIEAEAVMLGQPYFMSIPEVIGVRLVGSLKEGVTATDLVLSITELLRKYKVVGKFVEYFGKGVLNLSIPDRATISNMSPECGCTVNFFPVDDRTIEYMHFTNRSEIARLVEKYYKLSGLFFKGDENPRYTDVIEFDLSKVEPCLAGPSRPQDKIVLKDMKSKFLEQNPERKSAHLNLRGEDLKLSDGDVVIAAITSCTNTSNPSVLIGAGLLAKKAFEKGLKVKSYVKTSLAPGSKVVTDYLKGSGLLVYLESLGFYLAGYGCTTCIGNSGSLHPEIEKAVVENGLNVAAVLSGNRNFEARIHNRVRSNFLASPMLVVAFALAGRADIDLTSEPLAVSPNGEDVYLKDIWPSSYEINEYVGKSLKSEFYHKEYDIIFNGDNFWNLLEVKESENYHWEENSTYIRKPPFLDSVEGVKLKDINNARALLVLGDSVTTDHISPAGSIPKEYPAGKYLISKGVDPRDFNTYGSRRGNHEVMMRGTFGNVRIKNRLVSPKEGGFSVKFPEIREEFVYDIAMDYVKDGVPLVILAKKEYGSGSSRDWAAKGAFLLGIKAVIGESYERIHRSNLIGMGVLPLQFKDGETYEYLGIKGDEVFEITGLKELTPGGSVKVTVFSSDGSSKSFEALARVDTEIEVEYYKNGGILPYVLKKLI